MRKASLFAASCIALVAFLGLSSQAFALHDTACDPYGNAFGVFDFSVNTDSQIAYAISGVSGRGVACGSEITAGTGGSGTLNDHAVVSVPPGVAINPTSGISNDSYAGNAVTNILTYSGGSPVSLTGLPARVSVDSVSQCQTQNGLLVGGPLPGTIIACYKGKLNAGFVKGHNWSWAIQNGLSQSLVIGPFYNDIDGELAGLTRINPFSLCAYAGAVGGNACGPNTNPWLQKNGDASGDCSNGKGIYSVTATNRNNQTTAPASYCVYWELVPPDCGKKCKNIDLGKPGEPGTGSREDS